MRRRGMLWGLALAALLALVLLDPWSRPAATRRDRAEPTREGAPGVPRLSGLGRELEPPARPEPTSRATGPAPADAPDADGEGTYALEGLVLDDLGRPVPTATVVAIDAAGAPRTRGITDPEGRFSLSCPTRGPWGVEVIAVGLAGTHVADQRAPGRVEVTLLRNGTIRFDLRPPGRDPPPAHATVTRRTPDRGGARAVIARGTRGFVVSDAPPGQVELRIDVEGFLPARQSTSVRPGEESDLGTILLGRGVVIAGRVEDAEGQPVQAVLVRSEVDPDQQGVFTSETGEFRLGPLPEGQVTLRVDGRSRYLDTVRTVEARDGAAPVLLRVRKGALLDGRVVNAGGASESRPSLRLRARAGPPRPDVWIGVDADGRFRVRVEPGAYALELLYPDAGTVIESRDLDLQEGEDQTPQFRLP